MKLFSRRTRRPNRNATRNVRIARLESLEKRQLLAAEIVGTFYEDVDSSRTKTGPDGTLGGWVAFVDIDRNGVLNDLPDGTREPNATANGGGDYKIIMTGIPSGIYRVTEELHAGWTPTAPAYRDVSFNAGQSLKVDFFNFAGGTIEGIVWNDVNQNKTREASDPGLAGWTVFLDINTNGSLDATEPSTVTDSDGFYQFTDVPAGDYEVTEIQPVGWDTDFDIKQTAGVSALTTVTQDFANFSTVNGSVSGSVWNDQNGDGDRAIDHATGLPTEPGLEGWTIFIDDNGNGALDATELSTTTDAFGYYTFPSVLNGSRTIREVLPSSTWTPAPGFNSAQNITVRANENNGGVDFANFTVQNGAIIGTIWNDINRDGMRNSVLGAFVEPGLQGWTVYLDMNHSGAFDTGEPTVVTDVNGSYSFPDLQIGEYEVIEVVPSGWETAPGFGDNNTVRVYSGATSTAPEFANFNLSTLILGSVSGAVWDDVNGNGIRDTAPTTEPGSSGWIVFLDVNGDRVVDVAEPQDITAADGTYTISGVTPGSVTIVIQSRSGWHATSPIGGARSIALKNGENVLGVNFGEEQLKNSSILGTAFADKNENGIRDAAELGLSRIVVYLDLNNNAARDATEPWTTTSEDQFFTPSINEAGTYSFTHLASGTYQVRQELPTLLSATPATEFVHSATIAAAQNVTGVDFADVYRRNEIHGIKFDDSNHNGVQEAGENGIAGTRVFIDLDRDDIFDAGEPETTTGTDGSYEFLDLGPGAYVIREALEPGHSRSWPTTTGGILWPAGVSNPAVGTVSPLLIEKSLSQGESYSQTVSITLPGSGGLTNLVDVFLLFDDTGSFTFNSPIVRGAFPTIMSQLQTSLPGIDLGFGVGRFEEYANFASEYSTGRPFVLNQPIVASGTTGYQAAIQAALDRTAPGYGGDQPETDIEALYQLVTGLGFDGNNNGSVLDSGAAGLTSTQLTPGNSGDVPSFASFAAGTLPSDGTIGGGGFRAGALPVVLLATDTGFAYQPKGEASLTGVGGLTLPISALTQTSRPTTPFGSGAGLQETITGLNALGALVIGLGTNPGATIDPRQGLEAISKLTGATNQSTTTIANGTPDPIAPGDPFYFQIASGFAGSVSAGVVNAIQNAVTNVAVNITVRASDPRVHIINHTGTRTGVTAGQTASFDIEFTGDGIPHRFDLQFVREGTNVVLGSIPVVLGTPVPGDGYHFDDLDEGEIEYEDHFGDYVSSTTTPNIAPSFTVGANQVVAEDAGVQTVTSWATNISAGPVSESSQAVNFLLSNDNTTLFSSQPQVSPNGTLTFTSALDAFGSAVVTVRLHDNGGTASGGQDTSSPQTFTINVTPVNDAPVGIPTITGTATEGQLLSSNTSGISDADGLGAFSYQWLRDAAVISGASASSYLLSSVDVGSQISVHVSYIDGHGVNEGPLLSLQSAEVLNVNDAPVGTPEITGNATEGQILTANTVGISDADGLDTFNYQWMRNGVAVSGATASTYLLGNSDVDTEVSVQVSFVDGHGTSEGPLTSAPTAAVLNVNDPPVGVPTITGTATEGQVLTANTSGISDADGLGTFSYQWLRNGLAVSGATTSTYLLGNADVGTQISVQVSYLDGHGTSEGPLVSAQSAVVINVNDPPVGVPMITGTATEGQTLAINTSGISDADGLGVFGYQWLRDGVVVSGRTASTYLLGNADVGTRISVQVSYLDGHGTSEGPVASIQTAPVFAITAVASDFLVVDLSRRSVYKYDSSGNSLDENRLNKEDEDPRGLAVSSDGSTRWVVDSKGEVFIYDNLGGLLGSWQVGDVDKPEGVTVHGNDLWIVDREDDRVHFFAGGALRRSGSADSNSSFRLARGNRDPFDIVTNGTHIWIVNDTSSSDSVFRYSVDGSLEGSWAIDPANSKPTGLTISASNPSSIWIVDASSDQVFEYVAAADLLSGSQSASSTFPLAARNRNPQGIALSSSSLPSFAARSGVDSIVVPPLSNAAYIPAAIRPESDTSSLHENPLVEYSPSIRSARLNTNDGHVTNATRGFDGYIAEQDAFFEELSHNDSEGELELLLAASRLHIDW